MNYTEWIVPGSSSAAIILVVIIFLRQMRYMQSKHEKSLQSYEQRLQQIANSFQNQVDRLVDQANANEERRMGQIQAIFDKFMGMSERIVSVLTKLEGQVNALALEIRKGKPDGKSE